LLDLSGGHAVGTAGALYRVPEPLAQGWFLGGGVFRGFVVPCTVSLRDRAGASCLASAGGPSIWTVDASRSPSRSPPPPGAPRSGRPRARTRNARLRSMSRRSLHIVAARLGDDPTTVLHTYAHLLPRSDEQAARTLAAVLVGSD
jgi:hypothetical protein